MRYVAKQKSCGPAALHGHWKAGK